MNDIARAVARESIRTMPADTAEASRYVQNQLALAGFDVDGLSVSVTTEEPDVVRLNLTYPVRLGPLAVPNARLHSRPS
jgi:hypothetical protein